MLHIKLHFCEYMQNAGTPHFYQKIFPVYGTHLGHKINPIPFNREANHNYSHLPNPALEIVLTAPQLEHLPILEPVNVVVILSVAALGTATTADLGKTNSLRANQDRD